MEENYSNFLEKYAQNLHNEQEHIAFLEWFGGISPQQAREVMDHYQLILRRYAKPIQPDEHLDLIRKIEARIDQIDTPAVQVENESKVKSLWSFLRRFAAAAVLILIGLGSYQVFFKKREMSANVADGVPVADAAPGGNRAVLTLADGSVINLNEAVDGQIARQSGIQISKITDGQLVYSKQHPLNGPNVAKSQVFNQIATPKAGQYQISLSDGTKVWLNALSSIRFPAVFDSDERKVEITGEVYFEVASVSQNSKRVPFKVVSKNQIIEVIGTHFNVNSYRDESSVKTTLLEGSVRVSSIENGKISQETVKLKPGEQSIVTPKESAITVEKVDTESAVAWQKGYFKFKDTGIEEVMRQLSRWYDLDVVYVGPLPQEQFTGYISKKVTVSSILSILEEGGGVKFKVRNKKVEVVKQE